MLQLRCYNKFLRKLTTPTTDTHCLNTPLRLSHFFAQVAQKIGMKCGVEESFNYRPQGLIEAFGYYKSAHGRIEALTVGRHGAEQIVPRARQIIIANKVYAAYPNDQRKLGNGDIASGNSWKFIGRGLKQLTGRNNYTAFTKGHRELWGKNVDFIADPDLLTTDHRYTVRSGVYFWLAHELYNLADKGSAENHVNKITKIIDSKTKSYPERVERFNKDISC